MVQVQPGALIQGECVFKDKEKQRTYQREWLQKRRQAWLRENGPCVNCGSWDDLEVHHKDPKAKVSHNVWSWSARRRDAELAKCEVRCSKCHRPITSKYKSEIFSAEGNPSAKLKEAVVRDIRDSQESGTVLAERYGVSPKMISFIRTGQKWKSVAGFA